MDFWFSIGSTYSYLSVMRLPGLARRHGVHVDWRPFNVREIMAEIGNSPFIGKPVKAAYMWHDIGRQARKYGLSPVLPAPYPLARLERANLVAALARAEGWVEAYTRETYRLWFEAGMAAGETDNLTQALRAIGQEPARVLDEAATPTTAALLSQATDEARAAGLFGAPSFIVNAEVFWGDDRLEDALAAACVRG